MRTATALAAYAALLAFGTYQTFRPTFDSGFARVQVERGDTVLNHYILEHTWQALANPEYRGSLFSPPFYHPEPSTIWYSEHLLGVAPPYWALRTALPADLAYQWWQIALNGLNFVAFAAVARWLRCPHLLALAGAYTWAFGLVHLDQLRHQQMLPRFWMPLAAYHAWTFALAPSARSFNRVLACVFLQGVTCVNTGWFMTAGLATFLPVALALRPGGWAEAVRLAKERRRQVALIVAGWGAALAAAFAPYLVVNWGLSRTYEECASFMPTVSAWLTGPPDTPWDRTLAPYRNAVDGECLLFCGFGLYALALAAGMHLFVTRRENRPPEFAAIAAGLITAAAWVLLTLAPYEGGPSLWAVARHVPGGNAIRCVSRVYVAVYLFGTLAAMVWLARATEPLRPRTRAVVLGLVAAILLYEQTGFRPASFDKRDFYGIADRLAGRLRGADAAYVVPEYTDTTGFKLSRIDGDVFAMWVGLRANVPVVNGYSGRWPMGEYPYRYNFPATDGDLRRWLTGQFRGKLLIVTPDQPAATRVLLIE